MNPKTPVKKILDSIRILANRIRIAGVIYNTIRSWFPIRNGVVLIESHHGKIFMGNPYYITKHLLEMPQYANLQIIIAGGKNAIKATKGLPNYHLIKSCPIHSLRYCYWLAVAEFLICDVTFPVYFSRKSGQKYLNTWHGTPLKTLGRRIAGSPFEHVANGQRNFLHTTHLLAPNSHTEQVLIKDYMIEHIWNGEIVRNGYPRNDIFFLKRHSTKEIPLPTKYNIAFMPTWRGSLTDIKIAAKIQLQDQVRVFHYLEHNLPNTVHIWVRLHPIIQEKLNLSNFSKINEFPDDLEPYDFISRCDALVTDYSSVMFDFSISHKPIILYTRDKAEYEANRSFCLDFSSVPFIKAQSDIELLRAITDIQNGNFQPSPVYKKFVQKYCPFDNANSTANLCSRFFSHHAKPDEHKAISRTKKKNVLIFVGTFWNNGITNSLKNLLNNIDKDRYNLFLCIDKSAGEKNAKDYFSKLDKRINYIPIQNLLSVGFIDSFRFLWRDIFCREFSQDDPFMINLWNREYRRQFGTSSFDTIVHFTGYERRVALLMSVIKSRKIIYVHNDMFLENKHRNNFDKRAIKLAYQTADKIATVRIGATTAYCEQIMDISAKINYVPNCLSTEYRKLAMADILDSLSDESNKETGEEIIKALNYPEVFRFINLGRFSPEKGQLRLIEAFEKVWSKHSNSQLFIMGGHGCLLETIIHRRDISPAAKAIYIMIGSSNPFPLLSRMNAMVFSSFYEGIGLVMFESLALNVPVISTDIPGPSEFLKNGYGLVVDNTVSGLIHGMNAAINEQIPFKSYDFAKHNHQAVERFYSLID